MQEVLRSCKNRVMVFDNKTKDGTKKAEQVQELLELVNLVMAENGGQPFTDELFVQLKVTAEFLLFNFIAFCLVDISQCIWVIR